MNLNQAKTQSRNENQAARDEAQARRMRRRHQNYSSFGTTSIPSIFALRW